MIKIIAGEFKGRKLNNLKIDTLRPTQAKVRKSIMDSIRDFNDKIVLDLFAGIGTLGIEAISRGAKEVRFVEKNSKIVKVLDKNLNMLCLSDRTTIVRGDVMRFLDNEYQKYDIIFADPPYRKYSFQDLYSPVSNIINNNGIFCYESEKQDIQDDENMKIKRYGNTQVVLWRKNE